MGREGTLKANEKSTEGHFVYGLRNMMRVCMADFLCTNFIELAFLVAICAFSLAAVPRNLMGPYGIKWLQVLQASVIR